MNRVAAAVTLLACASAQATLGAGQRGGFQEYADLIAADFKRCCPALTRHFQCLKQAWQDGIDHGQRVAAERNAFVARARALNIRERIGLDPPLSPVHQNDAIGTKAATGC